MKLGSVLDLGCGTGLTGAVFRPFADWLVGVDLSRWHDRAGTGKGAVRPAGRSRPAAIFARRGGRRRALSPVLAGDVFVYLPISGRCWLRWRRRRRRAGCSPSRSKRTRATACCCATRCAMRMARRMSAPRSPKPDLICSAIRFRRDPKRKGCAGVWPHRRGATRKSVSLLERIDAATPLPDQFVALVYAAWLAAARPSARIAGQGRGRQVRAADRADRRPARRWPASCRHWSS